MTKTLKWLLAGAALSLTATAAVAFADPQDAVRQAQADSASADAAARDGRDIARDARDAARQGLDAARDAQDRARDARDAAREQVRIYRSDRDGDHDVTIIRGGDRAESLSSLLQLRPDQQAALKTFLDATQPRRHDHMDRVERDGDGRTTLQKLDAMQSRMSAQQAEVNRKIAAIKAFYGRLDATQKRAFDAMPMLMVVGPSVGPMMIPRPTPIVMRYHGHDGDGWAPPVPPVPPVPPTPPALPKAPRG